MYTPDTILPLSMVYFLYQTYTPATILPPSLFLDLLALFQCRYRLRCAPMRIRLAVMMRFIQPTWASQAIKNSNIGLNKLAMQLCPKLM